MAFWNFIGSGSADSARQVAFDRVREHSELGSRGIPALAAYLSSADDQIVEAACSAIRELVCELPVEELPALDEAMRVATTSLHFEPSLLARLSIEAGAGASVLGVLSCTPNGYVRQVATRALGRASATEAIPLLLLRVNDWFGAIRNVAAWVVRQYLTPEAVPALIYSLPLVTRLERARRADHAWLVGEIGALLRGAGRRALFEGVRSPNRMVRRAWAAGERETEISPETLSDLRDNARQQLELAEEKEVAQVSITASAPASRELFLDCETVAMYW